MPEFVRVVLIFSGLAGVCFIATLILRLLGLIQLFNIPSGGMSPTLERGDRLLMERLTYLMRKPKRGDVAVFKTQDMPSFHIAEGTFFVQRIAGEPGEELRIADGKLVVNGKQVSLHCATGAICYFNIATLGATNSVAKIPAQHYFMLGDNSGNSLDSRYWESLPAANIKGRVVWRYWPPGRIGIVQ